ncbi:hypothetical protein D9Q98_001727 [Chlorella vulgaris]|uniref:Uncharacterized protein n=1 Tax=Chlorella vulgaris TaxID=3077 RepID=A0A9D4TUY8_CHLVU|nr:hypothetical protein D9Q98_001727 [Chlorella vulgaris]
MQVDQCITSQLPPVKVPKSKTGLDPECAPHTPRGAGIPSLSGPPPAPQPPKLLGSASPLPSHEGTMFTPRTPTQSFLR